MIIDLVYDVDGDCCGFDVWIDGVVNYGFMFCFVVMLCYLD